MVLNCIDFLSLLSFLLLVMESIHYYYHGLSGIGTIVRLIEAQCYVLEQETLSSMLSSNVQK